MQSDHRASTSYNNITAQYVRHEVEDHQDDHGSHREAAQFRDIHALSPAHPPSSVNPSSSRPRRRLVDGWETSSHRSSSLSIASDATTNTSAENFTTMSREFNALVLAGSTLPHSPTTPTHQHQGGDTGANYNHYHNLGMIGEEVEDQDREVNGPVEESNPLAIVPDGSPLGPPPAQRAAGTTAQQGSGLGGGCGGDVEGGVGSVHRVKKEEVEAKITAWQNAKVAKVNNRCKREEAVINGRENEQIHKATSWMKKVERKLEEKRVRSMEKMQNDIAKARRKAEERRATAEAKRGTKVARILELANLARAVGQAPSKRFFLF